MNISRKEWWRARKSAEAPLLDTSAYLSVKRKSIGRSLADGSTSVEGVIGAVHNASAISCDKTGRRGRRAVSPIQQYKHFTSACQYPNCKRPYGMAVMALGAIRKIQYNSGRANSFLPLFSD